MSVGLKITFMIFKHKHKYCRR